MFFSVSGIYSMEHIFTENIYGGLYEGSKDNPNEIPNIMALMIKIC